MAAPTTDPELEKVTWDLSHLLEDRNGGEPVYLNAFDIFGSTDLPRYLSLIFIYLVFAATLASVSVRHGGWLAPERNGGAAGERHPSLRPALLLLMAGIAVCTTLLVLLLPDHEPGRAG